MRGRTGIGLAIAAVVALLTGLTPSTAAAADIFVDTTADAPTDQDCSRTSCTLRDAVTVASPADVIRLPPGTYTLTQGELVLFGDRIAGTDARSTVIDGNGGEHAIALQAAASGPTPDATITGVAITRANGFSEGGGILVPANAALNLTDSIVTNNQAWTGAGIAAFGTLRMARTTVSGNRAVFTDGDAEGGGIYVGASGAAEVRNSTVSGNLAVSTPLLATGGGIAAAGRLFVENTTIAANQAPLTRGGGIAQLSGQAPPNTTISDSIVANNTGGACAGPVTSWLGDHNLDNDGTCGFTAAGDKSGADPLLGGLANNGGRTDTHALTAGSPAINTGESCPGTDQRGIARPQHGTCDIGAYEYVFPTLRVITQVVNDQGGTRDPGDFSIHVSAGSDVAGSPQPGSASGTSYTLQGGSYTVSADAIAKYAIAVSGDCAANGAVTLAEGDAKTCTIIANDPPPVIRKSVNVLPKSGIVRIRRRGQKRFVKLTEGQQIPLGSIIDTRKGRVTLVAAADKKGNTATADFYQGLFKIGQTKGAKPHTVAKLTEKLACARAGKATTAAKRKRKRRLWGDGSGRFRTEGQYSSATVRGTIWLTQDHCDRTWTKVTRGRVAVRDFIRKKTIIVRAGKQYIARAKKR